MCGIVGAAGNLTVSHEKAIKELLIVDSLRGAHSVGLAGVNRQAEVSVVKRACLPHEFLDLKQVGTLFAQQNVCLIGHNRYATQGKINNVNAHPFEFDSVVGVHNGSLNLGSLNKLPDYRNFDVDSEMIYNAIDKLGSKETLELLHGAFALVWWDKAGHTLHFARNDERPLWYVWTEDREAIFWASELWMLRGVLDRNKIKYKEPMSVETEKEYIFHIPVKERTPISKVEILDRKYFVAPASATSYSGYGGYGSGYGTTSGNNWGSHRQSSLDQSGRGTVGSVGKGAASSKNNVTEFPGKKPQPLAIVVRGGTTQPKDAYWPTVKEWSLRLRGFSERKLSELSQTKTKPTA